MSKRPGQNERPAPSSSSDANNFYPPYAKEYKYVGSRDEWRADYLKQNDEKIRLYYKNLAIKYLTIVSIVIIVIVVGVTIYKYVK